jgi:hypothetical protein
MPEYAKKTVAELTEILKGRSLPHSGKKAELIARLNEADRAAEASEGMMMRPQLLLALVMAAMASYDKLCVHGTNS